MCQLNMKNLNLWKKKKMKKNPLCDFVLEQMSLKYPFERFMQTLRLF